MLPSDYHQNIIDYYRETENAYKDSWDLNNSLAIHYGYWDEQVRSFSESLIRMNEVMMKAADIKPSDRVLDAGCGVGGSSIFLASMPGCRVTGITLSERQVNQATENAKKKGINGLVDFNVMNYAATDFPDASFNVVWGCESICYADNKEQFIKEAYRLLKQTRVEGFNIGLPKSPFHGFSVEFAEHRLYNSGDNLKHIDWKVYGRSDKLFIKKFEEETNLRCQIIIDSSSSMLFPDEANIANKLQFSCMAAASLITLLKKQLDAVGLSFFDQSLYFHSACKSSTVHHKMLMNELEKKVNQQTLNQSAQGASVLHQIVENIHKRSLVIILSDMIS